MIPPAHPDTLTEMGSDAGRFRRAFRLLGNAPNTWLLIRILVIVQLIPGIWDFIKPFAGKLTLAQHHLGLTESDFLSGRFWQPVSHALIHGSWFHLLTNAACVLLLGSKLEHIIVRRSFWLLCLYATLAGALLFLTIGSFNRQDPQTLVGASAICFAFLVFLTTLSPGSRFIPLFLSGRAIGICIILANLILTLIHPDLPTGPFAKFGTYLSENGTPDIFRISHACHLGGSLAGFFYGRWLLRPRVTLKSLQRARAKKEARSGGIRSATTAESPKLGVKARIPKIRFAWAIRRPSHLVT